MKTISKGLILSLWIGLLGCTYTEDTAPTGEVLRLENIAGSVAADGESAFTLTAILPEEAVKERRTVLFKTTNGVFSENSKSEYSTTAEMVKVNTSQIQMHAVAHLRSALIPGTAVVTANLPNVSIQQLSRTATVEFKRAEPELLVIKPDKLIIKPTFDSEVTFTVELKRSIGIVSLATPVRLDVFDKSMRKLTEHFRLSQEKSDSSGKCSFTFSLGDFDYEGKLTVIATALDDTGKDTVVKDTIFIYSKKS